MSDIKWIKITTTIFDDDKMKLIDNMPDRDTIITLWFKLLVLSGRCNDNGMVYLVPSIPYTDMELAKLWNRPAKIVTKCLDLFTRYKMIERNDKGIYVCNWYKHQNIDALDKLRQRNRNNQKKYREAIKTKKPLTVEVSYGNESIEPIVNTVTDVVQSVTPEVKDTVVNEVVNIDHDKQDKAIGEVFILYEDNIGMVTPIIAEQIKEAVTQYSVNWIKKAIDKAVKNNVRKWVYVAKVLENWKVKGIMEDNTMQKQKPTNSVINTYENVN